jgi:hypothetical protein
LEADVSEIHQSPQLEANGPYVLATQGGDKWLIADCSTSPHGADYARLFAVSPKLLKAAQDLLRIATRNDVPMDEQIEIAEAAIEAIQQAGAEV